VRTFYSDRNFVNAAYGHGDSYQGDDFVAGGWQPNYMFVYDPLPGSSGSTNLKYIVMPNVNALWLTAPSAPMPCQHEFRSSEKPILNGLLTK
jgi:hypothetical protein